MPALVPTDFHATIVWLGVVPPAASGIRSLPRERLSLGWEGPGGDRHAGITRPSCARVTAQYRRGTEIRNVRQVSVCSAEEMAGIAAALGLDRIMPEWMGATLVLEGLPDLSHLPPSARLQGPDGVTLVVDMQNRPCALPAREIEADHAGAGARFRRVAAGRRGVTAWVERPGALALGDRLRLHVPAQRPWAHHAALPV